MRTFKDWADAQGIEDHGWTWEIGEVAWDAALRECAAALDKAQAIILAKEKEIVEFKRDLELVRTRHGLDNWGGV